MQQRTRHLLIILWPVRDQFPWAGAPAHARVTSLPTGTRAPALAESRGQCLHTTPRAGSDVMLAMLKMLIFAGACACRQCNGFSENNDKNARLNGSKQYMISKSSKNFSSLLTSYSAQLPRWGSWSNGNHVFPRNVCCGWKHERLLKTCTQKSTQNLYTERDAGDMQKHPDSSTVCQSHSDVSV